MKKKTYLIFFLGLVLLFFFWFFYLRNEKENRLTNQGNEIIAKIEKYKEVNQKLPNSLIDIGIPIIDENNPPLYYEKKDSVNYIVWFAKSGEDVKTYYSDTKKWEDYQRFK
ncbi:hypothetical protein [Flavobacterium psychrophilum]|uniref:hypothetical protein n=1 Tax=Flavobacterium psychrophilum TaxID=96345 RepID=UPI000B7C28F6|nr:hypothetical protein [Flavobacterium psychrophilum]MCB6089507.1 hypothetical protein [Flavobacterium psychrophilum]MCB6232220.1 hypothetical protein [Flavobacterium psychrophilum]MEB3380573.1 hypothetical protein [Flavobacterium psychrophilum]SNA82761.1 conserved hypothetical protein [Flavobacterium psychrophilum]SNA88533.1 conserved hypothetical protein [Flavobacterium psychrophilum]